MASLIAHVQLTAAITSAILLLACLEGAWRHGIQESDDSSDL